MQSDAEWLRVRALYEEASALAPQDRSAFVARVRAGDAALGIQIEKLLAAEARDDEFLQPPYHADHAPSLVGRRVGAFRVLRAVASGGMGTVWEAEQDEPRRKVAVKTMHSGLASAQFRRRFHFESELLAGLRHPAIAQVYGAGVLASEDGSPSVPWFALEFVEGARTLFRYVKEEALELDARLRLFQRVCSAVQHAHQRGVIHRDLKAANLLVDREGQVKVIDFGIARLIDGSIDGSAEGEARAHTLAGEIVGTLEAMSPEQVQGRRDEVDARTDVYALGAILYELTTNRRPHELAGLSLAEAAHCIRDVEPRPPSAIAPSLPREIDWIVATAMAKEPARRYASASELQHEIERLLVHEPVLAGPPSRTYRLRKFCKRHRAGVAIACSALVAVIGGVAGAAYGFVNDQRARVAEAAARAEASLADRFSSFFLGLFEGLRPEVARGEELTRSGILKRGAAWVGDELRDRPLVQARLLRSIGHVHTGFAQYGDARQALEESVRLAREQGAAGQMDLAEGLLRLGQLYRLIDQLDLSERALTEALALEEQIVRKDSVKLGPFLNELGVLLARSRPEAALEFYRRAYDLEVARFGENSGNAVMVLANIGTIELRAQRYEAARDTLERALPLLIEHHGAGDSRLARYFGSLALVHHSLGNYPRALELQQRDLDLTTKTLGPDHPDIGMGLVTLAQITEALGDATLALTHAERAIEILSRRSGADHPAKLAAENARARLLVRARRFADARQAMDSVVARTPATVMGKRARLAGMLVLADVERFEGNPARAQELADGVLVDALSGDDKKLATDAHWMRAYALLGQGDHVGADAARLRAGGGDADSGPHAYANAKFFALSGDHARAIAHLDQAVQGGFRNAIALVDPDLDVLRAHPSFAKIAAALRRQ